ncbi:PST family polysaccharide transporter [Pedobacter sp. CAN_A7]|uniref:flippase n=1 Tax=Pedobacter sp. CAN_A7 TaxID=2787722 RepID=UPI0018C8F5E0
MNVEKKNLTRNVLSLSAVQIANNVLPLLSVPVISRIIGPDKFGSINFAASFIGYFVLLIGYGFDLSATRKIARDPFNVENRNQVFSEVFYIQSILLLISGLIFTWLLYTIPQFKVESLLMLFSFLICISTLFTQNWLFLAMQDMPKVAFFNLVTKLLFTVFILLLIKQKDDYVLQPLIIGCIQIVVSLASFAWAFKKYKLKFVKVPIVATLKLLWTERMIFFSLVVVNLFTSTNVFILGLYQSPTQVGYFTAGQKLIIIIQTILTTPLSQALYPYIGQAFGVSKEAGIKMVQKLLPVVLMLTGAAVLAIILLGPYLIRLFYGEKFYPAIPVLYILMFLPLIICFSNLMGIQIMLNLKMDKIFFRITACGAAISILLNLLMIKKWGYLATSFNWVLTEFIIAITMFLVLKRKDIHPIDLQYFKLSIYKKYYQAIKLKYWPSP